MHKIALFALCLIAVPGLVRCGGAPGTQFDLQDPSDKREFFCTLAKTQASTAGVQTSNRPPQVFSQEALEALRKACESELGQAAIDAAIEQAEKSLRARTD